MPAAAIKVTPIYGVVCAEDPLCYVLEIDGCCKILLDCGWDERFLLNSICGLDLVAAHIDFVLLSHPDLQHLGALPYAFAKLGLDCPVIATTPGPRGPPAVRMYCCPLLRNIAPVATALLSVEARPIIPLRCLHGSVCPRKRGF